MIPTDTILPPELTVLQFDADSRLLLRLRPNAVQAATHTLGSLFFHVLLAALVSGLVTHVFFSLEVTHFALTIAALLRCVWVLKRGTTLEILTDSGRYTCVSPVDRYTRDGIPAFNVNTSRTAEGWKADLVVEGYRAATRFSRTNECCAADPFLAFCSAINQSTTGAEDEPEGVIDETTERVSDSAEPIDTASVLHCGAQLLIVLVHGTWGRTSSWAFVDPVKSCLVRSLLTRLRDLTNNDIMIKRFPWSGRNSQQARDRAAKELHEELQRGLGDRDRRIVVIGHSHGGNIALAARDKLCEASRQRVRCVLMGTPFLVSNGQYDVKTLYSMLPRFVRDHLGPSWVVGFTSLCYVGMLTLEVFVVLAVRGATVYHISLPLDFSIWTWRHLVFRDTFLLEVFLSGDMALWEVPIVLVALFGPFLLSLFLFSRAAAIIEQVRTREHRNVGVRSNDLIVTYGADEIFQVLSMVVNGLSLFHQMIVLLIVWVAKVVRRMEGCLRGIWNVAWGVYLCAFAVGFGGAILLMLISAVDGVFAEPYFGNWEESSVLNYLWDILSGLLAWAVVVIFGVLLVLGVIFCWAVGTLLFLSLCRFAVFVAVGVGNQVRSEREFAEVLLGNLTVLTSPAGRSEALVLSRRSLFNHTKIYDDAKAIEAIADLVANERELLT